MSVTAALQNTAQEIAGILFFKIIRGPQNEQICYSMNGNMDILRILFVVVVPGLGELLCFDRIVHLKNPIFSFRKLYVLR